MEQRKHQVVLCKVKCTCHRQHSFIDLDRDLYEIVEFFFGKDKTVFWFEKSGCLEISDCPNGGQNYDCSTNVCTCKSGFILTGDVCVGMLLK